APAAPASSSRSQPTTVVSGDPSSGKLTTILTFPLLFSPLLFPSNASAPTQLSSLPQKEVESLCPALFRRSRRSLRRREVSRPPPTLGGTTSALLPLSISQSVSATFQLSCLIPASCSFLLVGCHSFLGLYSALGEYRKKRKLQNEMGSAPLSSWPWENFGLFK
ncbi:hypothetical protein S245_051052, partial [Arachis hypogaea]